MYISARIMAWHRTGDKRWPQPVMRPANAFLIWGTGHQWFRYVRRQAIVLTSERICSTEPIDINFSEIKTDYKNLLSRFFNILGPRQHGRNFTDDILDPITFAVMLFKFH